MNKDRRYLPQIISEVRATTTDAGDNHITGKGIVFSERSQKLGWFVEIIDPNALNGADIDDMLCFFNHNADYTLASLRNKTVELTIDANAASYDILAPDTQTIKDLVVAPIARGDVRGSSFMFDIAKNGDSWDEIDGIYVRYIWKIEKLYEMGPVSMPAYMQTTTDIAKRSFDEFIETTKQKETEAVHFRLKNAQRRLQLYK
jgi:HK97 family phage prohead protease